MINDAGTQKNTYLIYSVFCVAYVDYVVWVPTIKVHYYNYLF